MTTENEVLTPMELVAFAEDKYRTLVAGVCTQAELDMAYDALVAAKAMLARSTERAAHHAAVKQDLKKDQLAQDRRDRDRRADEAEQAVVAEPPVVSIAYGGIAVSIKLAGGRDHVARQMCEEAVRRTILIMNSFHMERIGRTRAAALMGLDVPEREEIKKGAMRRLEDELRVAAKLGAVEIATT